MFYLGLAVGESDGAGGNYQVNATDRFNARNDPHTFIITVQENIVVFIAVWFLVSSLERL